MNKNVLICVFWPGHADESCGLIRIKMQGTDDEVIGDRRQEIRGWAQGSVAWLVFGRVRITGSNVTSHPQLPSYD